ncbi:MAG TPA: glycosyltransferase family 4 protein, partial [Isosphaeraceae bacterium]|nr:glycosyltransferase family 4 protein [Isosphaeraceae bacterium]
SRLDPDWPAEERVPTRAGSLVVRRLRTSGLRFVGTWLYMRNLSWWLESNPVDLAYVSMLKHDAYATLGVARKRGFPVVLRPEGAGATGDIAWQRWGRFGKRIGQRCRQAEAVVAISRAIRDELLKDGYEPSRIIDLPNGVPVPETPWNRREGWTQAPRAVFTGRLAPEKGLDALLNAWKMVLEHRPTARLTLMGEGPQRPVLESLARELEIAHAVEMPGVSHDIEAALRACDLFVLPSREEGMSMALLEAMALGVPLVATSIAGNRKLVSDFKHGRLAKVDDPRSLASAILDQWADLDRAAHMGRAARSLVSQKYAISAVAKRHVELFEGLVKR